MSLDIGQDLIEIKPESALDVFTKPGGIDPYLKLIRAKLDEFVPDMDTRVGREEIASIAHKVSKSKSYLEAVGKGLADEQKDTPKKIDAARKKARDTLDAWRDEVRKPLTDWEQAEEARISRHGAAIQALSDLGLFSADLQSGDLRDRRVKAEAFTIDAACEEFEAEYRRAKEASVRILTEAVHGAERREAEQAELAAFRQAKAEQEQREQAERLRAETAARSVAEARDRAEAERRRVEAAVRAEKEAAERRERDLQAQAEAAERRAQEAELRAKREHEDNLAREKAEAERREANKNHCAVVNRAAVKAMVDGGVAEEVARAVVILIARKAIPSVTITY